VDALSGRVAIVTGAASGIGAAIADAYVDEGASVLLADRDEPGLSSAVERCRAVGAHVTSAVVDVADEAQARSMVEQGIRTYGRVDVLVNCAGMVREVAFLDMEVTMWDEMLAVDLRSVFLCSRWAAPHMVSQGSGRIINIASQLAIKGGDRLAHYAAAKAGILGLTKSLARELAPMGVLVNAIAPGPIQTPLVADLSAEWKKAKEEELPLRRFGLPEEVAPTAVLLASDPGGNLYVGQTLGPNGGDVMP
jgi:3-oxoacyl-[acyl-carrier protein] reductase